MRAVHASAGRYGADAGNSPPRRTVRKTTAQTASPLPAVCENVVFRLHSGVAREPALGIVSLRGLVFQGGGRERICGRVVLEGTVTPSAAVREPLTVLYHEIDVVFSVEKRHGSFVTTFPPLAVIVARKPI
jgi:hypothetical protein